MGIDIAKDDHMLVLKQHLGGCFPVDDIAEDASGFHVAATFLSSCKVIGVKEAPHTKTAASTPFRHLNQAVQRMSRR
jgi:hypothetical protein